MSEPVVIVDTVFVDNRCGHCKKLAPTWEELGASYKDNTKVSIAKVDCTVQKEACSKHGVSAL